MPSLQQLKGIASEDKAWKYFQSKNYQLIACRKSVAGVEVDLILKKDDVYYMVEVKTDNRWRMESPLPFKQLQRLKKAAEFFSHAFQCSTRLVMAVVKLSGSVEVYPLDEE